MRRQVALWGVPEDAPLEAVRRELARRAVPYVLLDQRRARQVHIDVGSHREVSGTLRFGEQQVHLEEIGAIFVRAHDIREILRGSAREHDAQARRHAVALERQLFVWADLAPGLVVNRPSALASNWSKPYQAEWLRGRGFEIPATLVTTTPDAVRAFLAEHRQVIYKSVSGQRSIVSRVSASELEWLDDVATCATQFQEHVPGTDWRVHVVGDDVHACEIRCAADDYRIAHAQGEAIEFAAAPLPSSIAERCHALARDLGLVLAGIDLRRTQDDAWYCFEVNTAPAFTYYEQATGQPLTAAVAQLLVDACRSEAA